MTNRALIDAKQRTLTFGNFSYRLACADVARITVNGDEVIQRIFVTVRDRKWQENPPSTSRNEVELLGRKVKVWARHKNENIDFEWTGVLEVEGERMQFSFEGHALQEMEVCRLGLVVLLPVAPVIGASIHAEGPDGSEDLVISQYLHPQPILDDIPQSMLRPFSTLMCSFARQRLLLHFSGDLFECEDQRNWGDASFKIYCTPLRMGFPRLIKKGSVLRQAVSVSIDQKLPNRTEGQKQLAPREHVSEPLHLGGVLSSEPIGTDKFASRRSPKLGRVVPRNFHPSREQGWMLGWDHIVVDLDHTKPEFIDRFLAVLPPSTMLELVMSISEQSELSLNISSLLSRNSKRIGKLLLRHASLPLPTSKAIVKLRTELARGDGRDIPLFALPNGFFVEFNRGKPFDLDVDGIAFPLSSTVHSDDLCTIMDNVAAVTDMLITARKLTGKSQICISPLALYFPERGTAARFPRCLVTPWLMSIVALASQADVASVTLAADVIENLAGDQLELE